MVQNLGAIAKNRGLDVILLNELADLLGIKLLELENGQSNKIKS